MGLKDRLGLYNVNLNQLRQTWNFNRLFLLVSFRLRVADEDLTVSLGERRPSNDWHLSSRMYRPLRWRKRIDGAHPDVVVAAQHGRFGNMIRQVTLAVASAEKLGIREVLVKSLPEFPRGTWVLDNGVALTHDPLLRARMIARPVLALGGDFFVKPRLPVSVDDVDFDLIARSLLDAGGFLPTDPLDPQTLVIHFRSGDAFTEHPHPGLGQPPFAFYERVIELENPAAIALVFEDYQNPVIEKVVAHVTALGIPLRVQSGSFREDLEVLLSARTLVTAQGTLTEALLLLSPHVQRWISFSRDTSLYFRRREIESIVSVFDSSDDYSSQVLRGNWVNSDAQRDLMMNFPSDQLEILDTSV